MKSRRVMTRDVVCVAPETKLARVWGWMEELRVRHMPVVDGGKLVGIISDRDVLQHTTRRPDGRRDPDLCVAAEVMTPAPITCLPDQPVSRVAELMLEHRIDSIPIVSSTHTLIGLVTSTDLIELLTDPDEALEHEPEPLPFLFALRYRDEARVG